MFRLLDAGSALPKISALPSQQIRLLPQGTLAMAGSGARGGGGGGDSLSGLGGGSAHLGLPPLFGTATTNSMNFSQAQAQAFASILTSQASPLDHASVVATSCFPAARTVPVYWKHWRLKRISIRVVQLLEAGSTFHCLA